MLQDLYKYLCKSWFEADIFKLCSDQLQQLITLHLHKIIYLTNDVIYKHGSLPDKIYFIKCGTVGMYDTSGVEVKHIEEGNFFSEQSLILSSVIPHIFTVVAIENCEMYYLSQFSFENVIESFPEEYQLILDILESRISFIKTSMPGNIRTSLQLADYFNVDENEERRQSEERSKRQSENRDD